MKAKNKVWLVLSFCLSVPPSFAQELITNSVIVQGSPKWLKASRINKITDKIERALEWDIRRIRVIWYTNQAEFMKAHGYDESVLAVTLKPDQKILMGPKVTSENFDGTFGHELGHVILYQKYKNAIPRWLEEGLANFVSGRGDIDYAFLNSEIEKSPLSIRSLDHPFSQKGTNVKFHYMLSTAVMKMISSKCKVSDLLQLSVGEKLEAYLGTFCGISDLDAEFKTWLARRKLPTSKH